MISAYYQTYKNKPATEKVLETFRRSNPNNEIYLISDNGLDFSDLADKYNCIYHFDNFNTGYHSHDNEKVIRYRNGERGDGTHCYGYDSKEAICYLNRVNTACNLFSEETTHILFLEDDTFINVDLDKLHKYLIDNNLDMTFAHMNNKVGNNLNKFFRSKDKTLHVDSFGVCGGQVISKRLFTNSIYQNLEFFRDNYNEIQYQFEPIGFNDSLLSIFCGLLPCKVGMNPFYSEYDSNAGVFHDRSHRK